MSPRDLVEVLRFRGARPERIANQSLAEWRQLITIADRAQLTFPLGDLYRELVPSQIREYIDGAAERNGERNRRFQAAYREIASRFEERGVEHAVLKGFSHCPMFCADSARRLQVDVDLWVPRESLQVAGEVAKSLGYEPLEGMESYPVDHLPTMLRRTGWQFRGDTYDPEIPPRLEIHFQLWDPSTERFEAEGLDAFWNRRVREKLDGFDYPALDPVDRVAYACLHVLRHILRGDVRPYHLYEIAWFLQRSAKDAYFWERWQQAHAASLIAKQAIVFGIVEHWFGCDFAPQASAAVTDLDPGIREWIRLHAFATILPPNKSELWLHLMLVTDFRDRTAILTRRLLPLKVPRPSVGTEVQPDQRSFALRLHMRWTQIARTVERAIHHTRAIPRTVIEGIGWWSRRQDLRQGLWQFLLAALLFEAGLFLFVLLYNLFLLSAGFDEKAIGFISSAMTAGSLAGILPAAFLLRRYSPSRVLPGCFLATAFVAAFRVSTTQQTLLAAAAFLAGAVLAVWAVSIPPTIAQLAGERGRPRAFSLFAGSGIALGVVAGPLGGNLPKLLASFGVAEPTRFALLLSCAFIALAAWPAAKLKLETAPRIDRTPAPNGFLAPFLVAVTAGSFATGLFNPFFNVYFAKYLHYSTETIGWVFSASQFVQVVAILASPALFRRMGLTRGIAATQALAAMALICLASGSAAVAIPAYAGYMMFQYMNEPGLFTLLTTRVPAEHHSGASARYFFFTHAANALAAAAGGAAFVRFGYPATLVVAGVGVLFGAILFWTLVANTRQMSS